MAAVLRIVDVEGACMAQGQVNRVNTPATAATVLFTLRQYEEQGEIVQTFLTHNCRVISSVSPTAWKLL
jgi:hypothetical protein